MPLIKGKNLAKTLGRARIMAGVTFEFGAGAPALFTGRNGSGKTLMLKMLAGILKPDAGTLAFEGFRARGPAAAFSPTEGGLDAFLTVRENLLSTAVNSAVDEQLAIWGLGPLARDPVERLSAGERRRVSLAAAFAADAELTLLDEPTAGLDARFTTPLLDCIRARQARGGLVALATHQPEYFTPLNPVVFHLGGA